MLVYIACFRVNPSHILVIFSLLSFPISTLPFPNGTEPALLFTVSVCLNYVPLIGPKFIYLPIRQKPSVFKISPFSSMLKRATKSKMPKDEERLPHCLLRGLFQPIPMGPTQSCKLTPMCKTFSPYQLHHFAHPFCLPISLSIDLSNLGLSASYRKFIVVLSSNIMTLLQVDPRTSGIFLSQFSSTRFPGLRTLRGLF